MKLVVVCFAAVATLALARPAVACGVPDFGAAIAEAFREETTEIHTPVAEVGGGWSTQTGDGQFALAAGYAWGEHKEGWLFPGSSVTRVMASVRMNRETTSVAATYGWYQNQVLTAAFDLGAEAQVSGTRGAGPTARLSVGAGPLALQLGGTVLLGDETRFAASAAVVVEVMDLTNRL